MKMHFATDFSTGSGKFSFFIYYSIFFIFIFFRSNLAIVDDDGIWKSGKHAAMTLNEHSRDGKVAGGEWHTHTFARGFLMLSVALQYQEQEVSGQRHSKRQLRLENENQQCNLPCCLFVSPARATKNIKIKCKRLKLETQPRPHSYPPPPDAFINEFGARLQQAAGSSESNKLLSKDTAGKKLTPSEPNRKWAEGVVE